MHPLDPHAARVVVTFACWNVFVHYGLTKQWARDEGFSEADAEEIAHWDMWTDRFFPGNRRKTKHFHFRRYGAVGCSDAYLDRAVREHRLGYLGIALHCVQDAVGHGPLGHLFHLPPIDTWARRSDKVRRRTEDESRRLLREYRRSAR